MKSRILTLLSSFLAIPSLLLAEEPSSGTLIMISSIGAWVLAAAAFVGIRRFRRARQQQRD
jgi:heme O synthase-like polyprenyltransferase